MQTRGHKKQNAPQPKANDKLSPNNWCLYEGKKAEEYTVPGMRVGEGKQDNVDNRQEAP